MIKITYTIGLVIAFLILPTSLIFSQGTKTVKVQLEETPQGHKVVAKKEKKQYDLSTGIAVLPDNIVSDDIMVEQIQSVEASIIEHLGDEKMLIQLKKELINLKAKRKYLSDNQLN